jgi:outer membrane immunogenic protein
MRSARFTFAALAVTSITSTAAAQSAFSGFYVGATVGYSFGSLKTTESVTDTGQHYFPSSSLPVIAAAGAHNSQPGSVAGGFTAGYNLVQKNWLLGFEVDYSALSLSSSHSTTATYPCCAADFTIDQTVKASSLGTARLRFGYVAPQWLFYGTAGLSFGSVKYAEHFTDMLADADESASQSSAQTGWNAGAGAEYLLGPMSRWSVKAEYLYASLGTMTGTSNNVTTSDGEDGRTPHPTIIFTHAASVSMNLIRVGINYHFK